MTSIPKCDVGFRPNAPNMFGDPGGLIMLRCRCSGFTTTVKLHRWSQQLPTWRCECGFEIPAMAFSSLVGSLKHRYLAQLKRKAAAQ